MHVFLTTDRLVLRRFTPADLDHLCALDGDPEVMRHVTGGACTPRDVLRDEHLPAYLAYYARGDRYGFWAAETRAGGEFLGWFHLRPEHDSPPDEPELGYRLRRAAWGRGYGTEGARALVEHAFATCGARRVVASAALANVGSWRIMEKVGLRRVRVFRAVYPGYFDDEEQEDVAYALDREDWARARAARDDETP